MGEGRLLVTDEHGDVVEPAEDVHAPVVCPVSG